MCVYVACFSNYYGFVSMSGVCVCVCVCVTYSNTVAV